MWFATTHCLCHTSVPQRKFIEAALRYYHLSQLAKREIGAFMPLVCLVAAQRLPAQSLRRSAAPSGGRVVAEEELMMALNAAVRFTAAHRMCERRSDFVLGRATGGVHHPGCCGPSALARAGHAVQG